MDGFFSMEILAGFLVGLLVLTIGLVLLQVWSSLQIRKMSKTSYQDDIKSAKHEAVSIVSEAQLEAQEVLAEANEARTRAMADASREAQATNESYQAELQNIINTYNQELDVTIKRGDKAFATLTSAAADSFNRRQDELNGQFDDVLESLSTVSATLNGRSAQAMTDLEEGIKQAAATLDGMMDEGEDMIKKHVQEHLDKLLDRAEADLAEYKKGRITLLDSHIERLVEDIAVRVLHKRLSLEEHAELAKQALVDAKEHNVL